MAKVAFYVLQGSVATYVRCGGKHDEEFSCKFLAKYKSEGILKVGQIMAKLRKNAEWHVF